MRTKTPTPVISRFGRRQNNQLGRETETTPDEKRRLKRNRPGRWSGPAVFATESDQTAD